MPANRVNRLLDQLDEAAHTFVPGAGRTVERILTRLSPLRFEEPEALLRFHETLLFLSAYPQTSSARKLAESALHNFPERVLGLRDAEVDLSALEPPDVSGIAGTLVADTFSYPLVRWLVNTYPHQVAFDWEWFEDENRLAQTWPRFMPLLEEDALVEANVPYREWLRAAGARGVKDLSWLVQRFESLSITDKERTELFDSQKLYVSWTPPFRATRTGMRVPVNKIFYHREPLIRRRDVLLDAELEKNSPALERLSREQGESMLKLAREASTTRYRELYGFTHGDPNNVLQTNLGRGVDLFLMSLPPGSRLPLRAYHAAMIFKNGVPVGYFEGLSLFERMESGFNLYYTFREGETAWLYARTLNIFRHLLGVTAFAIDPYQIGYENEEGIESGAFWFYRKLGFRPTDPKIMKLVLKEERRMAADRSHRTSARTLRKLAGGPMIFELNQSQPGDWDRFQVRNIGLHVQRRMATQFHGDAEKMRVESVKGLRRLLGITNGRPASAGFNDFAVALAEVNDLRRWKLADRKLLARIITAKGNADQASYLKLMQGHARLRKVLIGLGSR